MTDFVAIYLLGGILYCVAMVTKYGLKASATASAWTLVSGFLISVLLWPVALTLHLIFWHREGRKKPHHEVVIGKSFEQMVKENEGRQ